MRHKQRGYEMAFANDAQINPGVAATGFTAVEKPTGLNLRHVTLTANTTLPAIAGGADLAVGKLAITKSEANITADTPDLGLGTTIASGAVAVLGGTAAFENIMTGQTMNDCNGTAEVKTINTQLVIEAADAHTVYVNVADGWAANGDAAAALTGTIDLIYYVL